MRAERRGRPCRLLFRLGGLTVVAGVLLLASCQGAPPEDGAGEVIGAAVEGDGAGAQRDGRDLRDEGTPAGGVPQVPEDAQTAAVERVVDGDTIWVQVKEPDGPLTAGASHKIRLLEIDTPETRHPTREVECGGREAAAFTRQLLPAGSTVHLVADREDTDRYGRFLRYAWTANGRFFNEAAVREGHARAVLYPPNDRYIDRMRAAEEEARRAQRGIWGPPCDYDARSRASSAEPTDASAGPVTCHPSYPDVCIAAPPPDLDCGDVARRAFRVDGADPHRFDPDDDGVGCER